VASGSESDNVEVHNAGKYDMVGKRPGTWKRVALVGKALCFRAMDYKIKCEEIFGIELQLVAIADYQFVVSADRIIPSGAHEGGFGQYVDVADDIERALVIYKNWRDKIQSGEYELPTASDHDAARSEQASAFVGLEPFPELAGLTGGIRRTMRLPRKRP
jgi:hypothetical protein